jgi:replicative DNA helicase
MPDDDKHLAELALAKNRSGPTDTIRLRFTPSSMRFDNFYRE